jgi:lysozyme
MILGLDVSKWNKEMDWAKASSAGAKFAFIRAGSISATNGISYTDYQFDRNAKIAPDHMPVGFYWYFRPQWCALDQAEYFCNLIKDKGYRLPPVLDLESSWGMSAERITEAAKIFITEVYVRLDVWPLLYSRSGWLDNFTVPDAVWDFVDLWVARYNASLTGPWSDGHCIPRDFDDWKFWQYTSKGSGAQYGSQSASIDLNYFNGDQVALDEYTKVEPEPVGIPDDIVVRATIELKDQVLKYKGRIELV